MDHYALKTYGGVNLQILIFLTSALGYLHALAPSLLGKEPLVPIGQEAGWAENQSGQYGEEKNLAPVRTQTPTSQPSSP
jgi:hypothetical protein